MKKVRLDRVYECGEKEGACDEDEEKGKRKVVSVYRVWDLKFAIITLLNGFFVLL